MKYEIIRLLREKKGFVSGEELGEKLHVSRGAVWKNISKLREEGYKIASATNRGYFLEDSDDIINRFEISFGLSTKFIGKSCLYFDEVDSTNDEAKRQAEKGCDNGLVIVSDVQSNGKGRRGHEWFSKKGDGIWFSVVLKPDIFPVETTGLTLAAGLAVCRAIRKHTGLEAFIKWPNDIIINGKKAVGILTEMSAEIEKVKFIILGIGVNVNTEKFLGELEKKATSVYIETGKKFNRAIFLQCILEELESVYEKYIQGGFFKRFYDEYMEFCLNIGKNVKVIYKGREVYGIATGISEDGELIIKDENNGEIKIFSGEASVRLNNGDYI